MGGLLLASSLWAEEHLKTETLHAESPNIDGSKNGILLGIEINGGMSRFSTHNTQHPNTTATHLAFDGGVRLGYQHYFGLGLGLRGGVYVGVGNLTKGEISISKTNASWMGFELEYLPIKTGVDLEAVWDFWEEGKHTLALSLGVGYRFSYFVKTRSSNQGDISSIGLNFGDVMMHEIYPQLGLGYHYDRHQITLAYRFGDMMSSGRTSTTYTMREHSLQTLQSNEIRTQITQDNYISLGYSYRF
ncbi:hypothetical protein [Helicobacter pametensis]|uniref:hypothetical protein n=1 Tax=Helicobacter pametensis TaxID=95149 RepID=UPI0012EB8588|nr:hypothetical protein [Helicobacter pametensis]